MIDVYHSLFFIHVDFFVDMKGSKPGLTTVAVFNLAHCREYAVVQEAIDEVLEPLYPIDINKVRPIVD
jgi:hypothetical protein